ncbi:MAG: PEP-utilizing enzyme [Dehalococcoidia bacterium]
MEPWIVGSEYSERYPLWTRANVGEVFPDPVAPLSFTLIMKDHAEQVWRDALIRIGAFTANEFAPGKMEALGVFHSYCFLNASVTRIMGERSPGLSAQAMDDLFFGAQPGIPPYVEQPGDKNDERLAAVGKTFEWAFTVDKLDIPIEQGREQDEIHRSRPNLDAMSNAELWARAKHLALTQFPKLFHEHIFTTFMSPIPVGAIQQICAAVGRPADTLVAISGIGDVESAAPSMAMWKLGRIVAGDAGLMAAFDAGVDGLLDRIRASGTPASTAFLAAFDTFIDQFGCRGPNEWEVRCHTWETRPELALAAIDRMRLAPASSDPTGRNQQMAAERERVVAEIAAMVAGDPATQGLFLAACRAAGAFQAGRERTKTNCVKLIQEMRMPMHTIGRRLVAAGLADDVSDFGLVTADEIDGWLANPAPWKPELARRRALFDAYAEIQEPFVFHGELPEPGSWPKRDDVTLDPVHVGDVLQGFPGCPGSATGIARVILDPIDPTALEPGDILVAPLTDPSWTPLFVPAAAVVVDVGALQSHAMIVSRELGIPCVPSVTGATKRIPNGATITVNGDAGTVTIVALP